MASRKRLEKDTRIINIRFTPGNQAYMRQPMPPFYRYMRSQLLSIIESWQLLHILELVFP